MTIIGIKKYKTEVVGGLNRWLALVSPIIVVYLLTDAIERIDKFISNKFRIVQRNLYGAHAHTIESWSRIWLVGWLAGCASDHKCAVEFSLAAHKIHTHTHYVFDEWPHTCAHRLLGRQQV